MKGLSQNFCRWLDVNQQSCCTDLLWNEHGQLSNGNISIYCYTSQTVCNFNDRIDCKLDEWILFTIGCSEHLVTYSISMDLLHLWTLNRYGIQRWSKLSVLGKKINRLNLFRTVQHTDVSTQFDASLTVLREEKKFLE